MARRVGPSPCFGFGAFLGLASFLGALPPFAAGARDLGSGMTVMDGQEWFLLIGCLASNNIQ